MRKEYKMQQESLRNRLCDFLASEGITQKFIAKKVDIKPPILSKFKNGLVELDIFGVEALDNFLTSKGY